MSNQELIDAVSEDKITDIERLLANKEIDVNYKDIQDLFFFHPI